MTLIIHLYKPRMQTILFQISLQIPHHNMLLLLHHNPQLVHQHSPLLLPHHNPLLDLLLLPQHKPILSHHLNLPPHNLLLLSRQKPMLKLGYQHSILRPPPHNLLLLPQQKPKLKLAHQHSSLHLPPHNLLLLPQHNLKLVHLLVGEEVPLQETPRQKTSILDTSEILILTISTKYQKLLKTLLKDSPRLIYKCVASSMMEMFARF